MIRRYAVVAEEEALLWVHPTLDGGLSDVTVEIRDSDDVLLTTLDATATSILGLYQTDEDWLPPRSGIYSLYWQGDAGAVKVIEELIVAAHPTGNEEVTVPRSLRREMAATGLTDVQLTVYDEDLVLWGSSPYDATETSVAKMYETDDAITFSEEGNYILVWESALGSERYVDISYVGQRRGVQDVFVYVISSDNGSYDPLENVTVLVSLDDGTPVDQKATGQDGRAEFELVEGLAHVVSIRHATYTFSRNNITIAPVDPNSEDIPEQANRFYVITGIFAATFDPIEALDASLLSKMLVDVVDLSGRPIKNVGVYVNNRFVPVKVDSGGTSYGVMEHTREMYTDANGHVEEYFVRGQELEVAIQGTPMRRYITVPDSSSFSLMELLTGSPDPFTIVEPDIPTAPRRAL